MPLSPYSRPQDTITQNLRKTATREATRRNPLVVGPQFKLMLNDGRDLSGAKEKFNVAGATFSYVDANGADLNLTDFKPVTATAELFGEDLEALVADFSSGVWDVDSSVATLRNIRLGADLAAGTGTLNAALDGRQMRIGDVISIDSTTDGNASTLKRTVVGLLGQVTAAVAAASLDKTAAPTNAVTNAADSGFALTAGTSAGCTFEAFDSNSTSVVSRTAGRTFSDDSGNIKIGDEITLTVTTPGAAGTAEVTAVSTALGVTAAAVATVDNAGDFDIDLAALGYAAGTTLTVGRSGGNLLTGETIRVRVFPASTVPDLASLLTVSGTYAGVRDLRYVVEITNLDVDGLNGTVRVFDTLGEGSVTSNSDPDSGSVPLGGYGLLFEMSDDDGYYVGQKFYVDAVAAYVSTVDFDGVALDGPAINASDWASAGSTLLTDVKVYQTYTGSLDEDNVVGGLTPAVTAGADDWTYVGALGLNETATGLDTPGISPFNDKVGKVLLSYKAVVIPSTTESIIALTSPSDISDVAGESSQENWLGRGALESFNGNQSRVVYILRTAGDTVADFQAAVSKVKTTDNVYALAIMTDEQDVKEAAADHCTTMSNPVNRNFRRCYVGTDSPGAYLYWGELAGGGYRTASLTAQILTLDNDFRDDWKFTDSDVGSTVNIVALGQDYEITEVLSSYELVLDIDVGIVVNPSSGITITRPDTPAATAQYVANISESLSNRRCANIWSDNPVDNSSAGTEIVACKFIAAEIAGLRCALLPQQGLTTTETESVLAAPGMYTRFSEEDLDYIASYGTMVVTQESEGGEVFIRHQLTTYAESDEALAYEDNVGVIVDEFSYSVKDEFRGYRGKRNATPDTVEEIDDKLKALAIGYTQVDIADRDIGPAVLTFFDENGVEGEVTVRQDGDLADTLLTYTKLRVPLPLNGLNHYVDVEVANTIESPDNV